MSILKNTMSSAWYYFNEWYTDLISGYNIARGKEINKQLQDWRLVLEGIEANNDTDTFISFLNRRINFLTIESEDISNRVRYILLKSHEREMKYFNEVYGK